MDLRTTLANLPGASIRLPKHDGSSPLLSSGNAGLKGSSKTSQKAAAETGQLLSCPFRKLNPLKYNIRHYPYCASLGFAGISSLKAHILEDHTATRVFRCRSCAEKFGSSEQLRDHLDNHQNCKFEPVLWGESDEGIDSIIKSKLLSTNPSDEIATWTGIWKLLFPFSSDDTSPDYAPPIDQFELQYVQEQSLQSVLEKIQATLELAPANVRPKLNDSIVEIVTNYIRHTPELASLVVMSVGQTSHIKPSDSLKGELSALLPSEDTLMSMTPSFLPHLKLYRGTDEKFCSTTQSKPTPNVPDISLGESCKSSPSLILRNSPSQSLTPTMLSERQAVIEESEIDQVVDEEVSAAGAEAARNGQETGSDAFRSYDYIGQDDDNDDDTPEVRRDSVLRELLDHTYRMLFHTALDEVTSSGVSIENLIDMAHDFADGLATSFQSTPSQPNNTNLAWGSGGTQGNSLFAGTSSGRHPNASGSAQYTGGAGDSPHVRDFQASTNRGVTQLPRRRLPCPFRMKDPFTFNVRDYYSCSMTLFRDIRSLREHLRLYHRRRDGAKFICERCFEGFATSHLRSQHWRAQPACDVKEWQSNLTNGLEDDILYKRITQACSTVDEQWQEICRLVFRSDNVDISSEYRTVMEHFELAKLILESIPDLAETLRYFGLPRQDGVLEMQLQEYFGSKMRNFVLGQRYEPMLTSTITSEWHPEYVETQKMLQGIDVHLGAILDNCDEINRTRSYENNQNRGHGSLNPRTPNGLPTPSTQPVSPAPTLLQSSSQPSTERLPERPPKRPRLAPKPSNDGAYPGQRLIEEHQGSRQLHTSTKSSQSLWPQNYGQSASITPETCIPSTVSSFSAPAASGESNPILGLNSGVSPQMALINENVLNGCPPMSEVSQVDLADVNWDAYIEFSQFDHGEHEPQESNSGEDFIDMDSSLSSSFAPGQSQRQRGRGRRTTAQKRRRQ